MSLLKPQSFSDFIDNLQFVLATVLQLLMLVLTVELILHELWLSAFTGVLVLSLSLMPGILARRLNLVLPVEFSLITNFFLAASFAAGEIGDFYLRFWWWDLMLHALSALTIGMIGFLAIYVFIRAERVRIAPHYAALLSFTIAVTTGSLWEIFEFCMDWFFGFNMQKSGLVDTMTDMIVDAISAFIAALLGYFYIKNGDSLLIDTLIRNFLRKNPHLLRRANVHYD